MNETLANLWRQQDDFRGNPAHLRRLLAALESGTFDGWNKWRKMHRTIQPDLRGLNLEGATLHDLDLSSARLGEARIMNVSWWQARLANADLRRANLDSGEFIYADFRGANLDFSRLIAANLTLISAEGASFRSANLSHSVLNGARLQGADLTGARVTGTSAWSVEIDAATRQEGLIVGWWFDPLESIVDDREESGEHIVVRIDHLEAAHLLHLVSSKGKFKTIIDALTARVVLLLGNFGSRRKAVLNAIRHKLADLGYAPVVFDFGAPVDRDLIETVAVLAGLSRFVIADLTRPKSTPLESLLIAPQLMVPFASIIHEGERPFSMFRSLQAKYDWVLPTWSYRDQKHLLRQLKVGVVDPCEQMRLKLSRRRYAAGVPMGKRKSKAGL